MANLAAIKCSYTQLTPGERLELILGIRKDRRQYVALPSKSPSIAKTKRVTKTKINLDQTLGMSNEDKLKLLALLENSR